MLSQQLYIQGSQREALLNIIKLSSYCTLFPEVEYPKLMSKWALGTAFACFT